MVWPGGVCVGGRKVGKARAGARCIHPSDMRRHTDGAPRRQAPGGKGDSHAIKSNGVAHHIVDAGREDGESHGRTHSGYRKVEFPADRSLLYRAENSGETRSQGARYSLVGLCCLSDRPYLRVVVALTSLSCVLRIILLRLGMAGAWPIPEI